MFEEIKCRITGRVQMVMYRDFAERKARKFDVVGTVVNLQDGSVEVIAQGTPEQLKKFIECLHEGSVLSRVKDVAVEWRTSTASFDDFRIIF